jgi:branched-chain amino acid transport system permease protein
MTAPASTTQSALRSSAFIAYLPIAVTAVVLALPPIWLSDSRLWMRIAVGWLLFSAYGIAFNVIFGSTGQLFLCVGALAGIGGYTTVILADQVGFPAVISVAIATAFSCLLGGAFSWIAVRRRLDVIFTGIVTLAFSLSYSNFVLGRRNLTGGETGLLVSTGSDTLLRNRLSAYYVFLGLVVGYLVVFRALQRSHIGWAFRALRDDEVAAGLAGVDVARYRVMAGLIGSAMLGFTGSLYAVYEGFIGPTTYDFGSVDIRVLVMLAFGGIGTLLGPVIGAVSFRVLDEYLIEFGQLREVVYGVLILALFLGFRRGLIPSVRRFIVRMMRRAPTGRGGG